MALPFFAPLKFAGQDQFYFSLSDDLDQFISLTATTDATYSAPMNVTTQPVMSGQTVTDNLQEQPKTVTISGVVVVQYLAGGLGGLLMNKQTDTVNDFMDNMETWRQQRQTMTFIGRDGIQLQHCVITQFEAKTDSGIKNGLRVNITFQEVDYKVQIGRTSDASVGAKDGKDAAKTTKGSVSKMVDKGKTATNKSVPQTLCGGLNSKRTIGGTLSATEKTQLGNCETGGANISHGVRTYDVNAEKALSNTYKNTGGNPNKVGR